MSADVSFSEEACRGHKNETDYTNISSVALSLLIYLATLETLVITVFLEMPAAWH